MSAEITRLPNGLIVASDPMPHLESAAVGVWVNCGTRNEAARLMGISHMLEHMAFKGTDRRSAKDISTEIEAVGGELNAYTGREQTAFHARVLKDDVPLALDIISDILLHPTFVASELERERDVVIQEIGQARDTPDDLVFDHLQEACFPGQPMGWSILGSEESVAAFSRDDLSTYMGTHYRAGGMMLLGSGAITHEALVGFGTSLFGGLATGVAAAAVPARFIPGDIRGEDDLEQAHLTFAFPGVAIGDEDAITAQIFAIALGGGMSSRLFQEAREKRGLCYAINAFTQCFADTGMIGIYAGTAEDKAGEIAPLVADEMQAMATGTTEEETARARAQLKAAMLMGMESPQARCEHMATHLHAFGRILPPSELTERINAVDAAAVRTFAAKLCETGNPAIAAVGPVKRLETRETFARRFGSAAASA